MRLNKVHIAVDTPVALDCDAVVDYIGRIRLST